MRVYSWNMLFRNEEPDRAFDFIKNCDFDVFCLQEVPEKFLQRLKTLPYHLSYRTDALRHRSNTRIYLVILSRHPITNEGRFEYDEPALSLRSRIFLKIMRPFYFTHLSERGGMYADIQTPERIVRVFCLHLRLSYPAQRMKELKMALLRRENMPTIICGDFNILEKPHITPLNWLLGGRLSDTILYSRERTHIEKHFVEHELLNPLRRENTHPLSRSQLDHILVSKDFSIQNASVLPDSVGSDHHPIYAEIA